VSGFVCTMQSYYGKYGHLVPMMAFLLQSLKLKAAIFIRTVTMTLFQHREALVDKNTGA
jgi:hypothetical protein